MVNLEAYKKACVNKTRPMMHCNGKCQMLKKMKKQDGNNGAGMPIPNFYQEDVVLSTKFIFPIVNIVSVNIKPSYYTYSVNISSNYIGSIFHPPGA